MILNQDITAYNKTNEYTIDNDIVLRAYPKRIIELLKSDGKMKRNLSLLELGIGHGYSAETFSENFDDYTVIDADEELIEKYQSEHMDSGIKFKKAFFEEYETQQKWDVIVIGFVLEHVDNPVEILKKYGGFLKDSGRMFISVPNAESLHRRFAYEAGILKDMTQLSDTDIRFGHKRYYSKESLINDIEAGGLILKRIEGIWMKPFTTSQIISLKLSEDILREGMVKAAHGYPELSHSMLAEVSIN